MTPPLEYCGEEATARRSLAQDMLGYARLVARLKKSLFLRHVDLNVRAATPLLDIVARGVDLDLDAAIAAIDPPQSWPDVPLPNDSRRTFRGIERDFAFTPSQIERRHRYAGVVVRVRADREGDLVGVRILSTSVELTVLLGALRLDTFHGLGRIIFDGDVPNTIAIAMTGRPVSRLVDHRWLANPEWKVVLVVSNRPGLTTVLFETGHVPWRLPPTIDVTRMRELIAC